MTDVYKSLGFKQPDFLENPYGIRIYIGTIGKDDWCVEIPKELANKKCNYYSCNNNLGVYFVTEEEALRIAREYTKLAKK